MLGCCGKETFHFPKGADIILEKLGGVYTLRRYLLYVWFYLFNDVYIGSQFSSDTFHEDYTFHEKVDMFRHDDIIFVEKVREFAEKTLYVELFQGVTVDDV